MQTSDIIMYIYIVIYTYNNIKEGIRVLPG